MNRRSGLELLEAEMAHQHADALESIQSNTEMASRLAVSVARTRKLLLVGMGASHYANRIVEPSYRKLGIEAWACTAAELIKSPLPQAAHSAILVSQSGESGEILELLKEKSVGGDWFGMTLDPSSALGRSLPCLIGAGGGEIAFAATRSLLVTLALHAAVLSVLGDDDDATGSLQLPPEPQIEDALSVLADKTAIVISGRGALRGLAEANALMLMELARMPVLGFEFGQFRHGPLELLAPSVGVILLRGFGPDGEAASNLSRTTLEAGSTPVIFDCSGKESFAGAVTVGFPPRQGLAAVFAMLTSLQRLIVAIAAKKVERVGEPVRSAKITRAMS